MKRITKGIISISEEIIMKGGENMKRALFLAMALCLAAAPAMAGISASKHNLGITGTGVYSATDGTSEICIFCHTPHNAVQNVPLWNRSNPNSATFQFYSSGSKDMSKPEGYTNQTFTASSISLFCMSCHDGTTGLWSAVKNKFGKTATMPGSGTLGGPAAIGQDGDLRNDHPVNIIYDPTLDLDFRPQSEAEAEGVRFFADGSGNDRVECASCHNPHETRYGKFLRRSNATSGLCLACHQK